jgi:hypothetical protein
MTVEEHPAQRDLQLRRIQVGVPWANRMVLLIEDSNQPALIDGLSTLPASDKSR